MLSEHSRMDGSVEAWPESSSTGHWIVYWDPAWKRRYYFNTRSSKTTWDRPVEVPRSAVPMNMDCKPTNGCEGPASGVYSGPCDTHSQQLHDTESQEVFKPSTYPAGNRLAFVEHVKEVPEGSQRVARNDDTGIHSLRFGDGSISEGGSIIRAAIAIGGGFGGTSYYPESAGTHKLSHPLRATAAGVVDVDLGGQPLISQPRLEGPIAVLQRRFRGKCRDRKSELRRLLEAQRCEIHHAAVGIQKVWRSKLARGRADAARRTRRKRQHATRVAEEKRLASIRASFDEAFAAEQARRAKSEFLQSSPTSKTAAASRQAEMLNLQDMAANDESAESSASLQSARAQIAVATVRAMARRAEEAREQKAAGTIQSFFRFVSSRGLVHQTESSVHLIKQVDLHHAAVEQLRKVVAAKRIARSIIAKYKQWKQDRETQLQEAQAMAQLAVEASERDRKSLVQQARHESRSPSPEIQGIRIGLDFNGGHAEHPLSTLTSGLVPQIVGSSRGDAISNDTKSGPFALVSVDYHSAELSQGKLLAEKLGLHSTDAESLVKARAVVRGYQARRRLAQVRQRIWLAGLRVPRVLRLRALFRWLDDSGDGSIDSTEWRRASRKYIQFRRQQIKAGAKPNAGTMASAAAALVRKAMGSGRRDSKHTDDFTFMRIFNRIDTDSSGTIELDEFVDYFMSCASAFSLDWMRDTCAAMLHEQRWSCRSLEKDRSSLGPPGIVSHKPVARSRASEDSSGPSDTPLYKAASTVFDLVDKDGDGRLDVSELRAALIGGARKKVSKGKSASRRGSSTRHLQVLAKLHRSAKGRSMTRQTFAEIIEKSGDSGLQEWITEASNVRMRGEASGAGGGGGKKGKQWTV